MKPQRSRSRNNKNRNRGGGNQGGNVVNRVFDSSGPEGKVRGTPSQVIEKYNQLARDAQLSNDRVAMENFQQHAEHYLRLLGEAQKEADAKREEQERQNRERQAERDEQERQNRERQAERDRERNERQEREAQQQPEAQSEKSAPEEGASDGAQGSLLDGQSDLVETPEAKPKTRRAPRRKPKPKETGGDSTKSDGGDQPEAAE
jgi:flagellar biosynthesis GTPase FlhF